MKAGSSEKRSVTPKQAITILEKNGYQINEEEAQEILDFLYFLGKLTVNQYIKDIVNIKHKSNENSRPVCKSKH